MTSSKLKKLLLTGTAVVALTVSSQAFAANQDDNTDNGSTTAVTAGNSISFTAPAAGTDEIFNVADGDNIGEGGVVVSATTADGVGTLRFDGDSTATGTVGSSGNAIGRIEGGVTTKTATITGNTWATTVNIEGVADPGAGALALDFGANVTATTFEVISTGATNANAVSSTVTGNYTATTTTITAGAHANDTATLTLNGTTHALGTATLTEGAGGADATIAFGANATTVSGTIDGDGAGKGIITAAGSTTFSGKVGTTSNALLQIDGGAAGKTVTFSDTVAATTTNITSTGEIEFDGAVTTDIVFGGAGTADLDASLTGTIDFNNKAGTATLADGVDVSSTIDSSGGANGTLTIEGTSTVTGIVGAGGGGTELATINVAGKSGKTATFSAAVDATTVNLTGAGTAKFDDTLDVTDLKVAGTGTVDLNGAGTGALDFDADGTVDVGANWTGAIDASSAGIGTVNFSAAAAGPTTIGATNKLKKVSISAAGVTVAAGNTVAPSKLSLGDNNLLNITGTFDSVSGDQITTVITDSAGTDHGRVAVSGVATVATGTILNLQLAPDAAIANGEEVTLMTAGTYTGGTLTINALTPGFTWTNTSDGTNLKVTAATAAITSNTDKAYVQIVASAGGKEAALETAILAAGSYDEQKELVEGATADVDGAASVTLIDAGVTVQGVADTRMASLRTGGASGMAAGSEAKHGSLWAKTYYSYADQDLRDGIDGYQSDTFGLMVGADRDDLIPGAVVGLAFNYGVTNADSDDANTTDTEVNSYGFTLYGSRDMGNNVFLNGQLGYAFNDIEATRHACGGAGLVCNGDTDSDQFSAKLLVGRDYTVQRGATITPKVYASYISVDTDGYTETGTGTTVTVQDSDIAALNLGVDVEASWSLKARDGIMKPSVNVGYAYDAINDAVEITSTFTGGGAAFQTTGAEPAESTFNAGLGLVYETDSAWDISARYDAKMKEDYQSHNGMIRVVTSF